jgi:hypothetical protein
VYYNMTKPTSNKKWDYDRDVPDAIPKGGGPDQRIMRQIDKVVKRVKHSMSAAKIACTNSYTGVWTRRTMQP